MNPQSRTARTLLGALALLLAGAAGVVGVVPRLRKRSDLDRMQAEAQAPRLVRVTTVKRAAAITQVTLPGTSAPFQSTTLYAKAAGFLRRNLVDVGHRVKAGQLLAEIDSPETEEDVRVARIRVEEASVNVEIVQRSAQRNSQLGGAGVVSQQQVDDSTAQVNFAVASLKTRQAEFERVSALRGYQRVVAPFDGEVTRRGYDRGMLLGTTTGGGAALFEVAQVDQLRVFVDVPQYLAREVVLGAAAVVFTPAEPGRIVSGKVVRISGVLDQTTRMLHTEVHIPGDGTVLPGAFVYVRFQVTRSATLLAIPANALIVRKEGTLVARVVQGRIALTPVQIARDLGKDLELVSGINLGEVVVTNPQDDLSDGLAVRLVGNVP